VLLVGVIAPVEALIVKPAVDEYVPPAVPVRVTAPDADVLQNGEPAYVIVADGAAVIVTLAVVVNAAQPPDAATV
jgi:hypothetical protein